MATSTSQTGQKTARAPRAKKAAPPPAAPAPDQEAAAPSANAPQATAQSTQRGRQQVKIGRVVSNKMDKTVVVTVENTTTHRLYHRYMKRTSKFAAHDEQNQCKIGDVVEIVSSRPLSRTKRWRVRRIVKQAE